MLDFTSALYLGLPHPSASLGSWEALSLGRPAALDPPPGAQALARQVAALQGLEAAVLLPSTLHLFRDVFALLATGDMAVLVDRGAYPIARWGVELAGRGLHAAAFAHHDPGALAKAARDGARHGRRPVILCDGCCPHCGRMAPLAEYATVAARHGGILVIDDTQALGVVGECPSAALPLGTGGGGSLRCGALRSPHVVVGASLAKAFGVPLAVLSGNARFIRRFRQASDTLVHCSPPAVPLIRAALNALALNRRCGDGLRRRLSALVQRLRAWAVRAGLQPVSRLPFPMQPLRAACPAQVALLQRRLLRLGVRTVITRACNGLTSRLTFLVTAGHQAAEIDRAGALLAQAAAHMAAQAGP